MTCDAWDIVTVPFPFTDEVAQKKRPALVVSRVDFNRHGHTLLAMITTSAFPWPADMPIQDLSVTGLSAPCVVRLKLFTLDNRLMLRKIGHLSKNDSDRFHLGLKNILSD